MAITIVATVGGASSNSYVTEAELVTYAEQVLGGVAILSAASDEEDRRRALVMATNRLGLEVWRGRRVTSTQRLAHPRYELPKIDGIAGAVDYPTWGTRSYYESTEIAQPVKDACCALALNLLDGWAEDDQASEVESFSSDGVSIKFRQSASGSRELPLDVRQLIEPLILSGRIERA